MSKNKRLMKFVLTIFVISFLLIQFSLAQTTQRVGCCTRTTNGNTCQDYTYESDCQQGSFYNGVCANVPDCKLMTCATADGCLFNYPKLTCDTNGGSATIQAMPAVCEEGCCGISNRGYGVMTKKECQDQTAELGYEITKMTFISGIISEKECDLRFAGSDRGCCYNGAATCSFGTREECVANGGDFRQGIFCSQIIECEAFANQSQGCGTMDGDKNKLCYFDSQGNQEDCWQECTPQTQMCTTYFNAQGKSVPNCTSTICTLDSQLQNHQVIVTGFEKSGKGDIVQSVPVTANNQILNGHSACYNFYSSNDKENTETNVEVAVGKSTGLQNNKLVCMYGEIVSQGLGPDRNTLCVPGQGTDSTHATTRKNKYEICASCGEKTGFLDSVGEFFHAGVTYLDLGSANSGIGFGRLLEDLGKHCTEEECTNLGDCVYHAEIGKGLTQGDNKSWGGLGLNARDIGQSCSPKYPAGGAYSTCSSCGVGGDSLFNMCEEKECLLQGDCEFTSNGPWKQAGIGIYSAVGLALSAKFNAIPTYVTIDCLISNPATAFLCIPSGMAKEVAAFTVSPAKLAIGALGGVKKVGYDWIINPLGNALIGEVTNKIKLPQINI